MSRLWQLSILAIATVLLFTIAVSADIIHLKDGRKLEGKIVKETEDNVTIRMNYGEVTVTRQDIERIEEKEWQEPPKELPEKPKKIKEEDEESKEEQEKSDAAKEISGLKARVRKFLKDNEIEFKGHKYSWVPANKSFVVDEREEPEKINYKNANVISDSLQTIMKRLRSLAEKPEAYEKMGKLWTEEYQNRFMVVEGEVVSLNYRYYRNVKGERVGAYYLAFDVEGEKVGFSTQGSGREYEPDISADFVRKLRLHDRVAVCIKLRELRPRYSRSPDDFIRDVQEDTEHWTIERMLKKSHMLLDAIGVLEDVPVKQAVPGK